MFVSSDLTWTCACVCDTALQLVLVPMIGKHYFSFIIHCVRLLLFKINKFIGLLCVYQVV